MKIRNKNLTLAVFILLLLISLRGIISSAVAMILGFLFTLIFGINYVNLTSKTLKYLLKISIVGLGFGMFLEEALQTSQESLSLTFLSIVLTLVLGYFITKLLKLDFKLGYLISSGTSICGGSAIAATSAVIKAPAKIISIALGVVFFLNAVALFIFPSIGHFFGLSQHDFGLWAAIAIHDTSSVVGTALDYGEEALKIATTVKLARTLWIIPIAILSMFFFKSKDEKIKIPWFILFFILAILSNTYFNIPEFITSKITTVSKQMLMATLFLVGTSLSVKDIKETGIKPFVLGVSLWICISIFSLVFILNS